MLAGRPGGKFEAREILFLKFKIMKKPGEKDSIG